MEEIANAFIETRNVCINLELKRDIFTIYPRCTALEGSSYKSVISSSLISGPVTASFGIPAGKSLFPLKKIKLNIAPLRRWFMAVDALSNLFYSAARSMHLTEWGLLHCLYCSMDVFFFCFITGYTCHIYCSSRESHEIFFTSLPLRDRSSLNFYFFWLLCLFFALTILMLVRQMNYLKDVEN